MNSNLKTGPPGRKRLEIVINHGRVMDPATRTDVYANVGISGGKIVEIVPNTKVLDGDISIDATGLVVAPGFINVHGHGSGNGVGAEFHLLDGITTEITGHCGYSGPLFENFMTTEKWGYPLADYFDKLERESMLVNLASFVGHNTLRENVGVPDVFCSSTKRQIAEMVTLVRQEIEYGALGVSFGPGYHPGADYEEMVLLAKEASKLGGCAASHVRDSFAPKDIDAVAEAINTAREADIPLMISHLAGPTFSHKSSGTALELISEALEEGLKIATDCHPYDAAIKTLSDPMLDKEPIEEILKLADADISDVETAREIVIDGSVFMNAGEAFSSLDQWNLVLRKVKTGEISDPIAFLHIYKAHKIWLWLGFPHTMLENDGVILIDPATGRHFGHPRFSNSFAKFLGYWVRERGVCDLMTALGKTSTLAAIWLGLHDKGRIQVGCDADITVFDPSEVTDRAPSVEKPAIPPCGIPYIIVNGLVAVFEGNLTGRAGGKVIRRTWRVPGTFPAQGSLLSIGVDSLKRNRD